MAKTNEEYNIERHIERDSGCAIGTVMTLFSCFNQSEEVLGELDWDLYRRAMDHLKVIRRDYKLVKK